MDMLVISSLNLGSSNATEQMTGHFAIQANTSAKLRLSDMYVEVISCFHSILRQRTWAERTQLWVESSSAFLFFSTSSVYWECHKNVIIYSSNPKFYASLSEIGNLSCITSYLVLPGFLMYTFLNIDNHTCNTQIFVSCLSRLFEIFNMKVNNNLLYCTLLNSVQGHTV